MTRHYQRPVLLIEFEEGKSFSLQSTSAVHSDISHTSVASKLVLLTLHFPEASVRPLQPCYVVLLTTAAGPVVPLTACDQRSL